MPMRSKRSVQLPVELAPRAVVDAVAYWAQQLESAVDPQQAAGALLRVLASSVAASRGSLMLVNPRTGRLRIVAGLSLPAASIGEDLAPAPRRISDWVLRERRAIVIDGEVRDERFEGSAAADRIVTAMCLPLWGERGVVGVVNLARTKSAATFTPEELMSVETVSPAIAAILERIVELGAARLLRREFVDAAARPAWPTPRDREIAFARSEGLGPSALVCEVQMHADGTLGAMLADPLGNMAQALRVGEWLRGLFYGAGIRSAHPGAFATEIHRLLRTHQPGAGARIWLAALGTNGSLRSCAAGYPPPFCLFADGETGQRLDEGGPALSSLVEVSRYEEAQMRLLPGDAVVVVNDGLLMSSTATGQAFGDAGVLEQLQGHRRRPLESVVEALTSAARSHARVGMTAGDFVAFALRFTREN